jgi:hypothetical protein
MNTRTGMMLLGAALVLGGGNLSAQKPVRAPKARGFGQQREAQKPRRQQLEQRFRERSEEVVRKRLNLNDDQMNRLRAVNADIGGKRDALLAQERTVRMSLRDEMSKGSNADQGKVSKLMADAHDLQVRRFALQQDEQKQLSGFMSPMQVAQYVGLQTQLRQRIRQMQSGSDSGEPDPNNP